MYRGYFDFYANFIRRFAVEMFDYRMVTFFRRPELKTAFTLQ